MDFMALFICPLVSMVKNAMQSICICGIRLSTKEN